MKEHPSLDRLQQWLDSYLNFERLPQKDIFWLDTMEFLCQKLGNPQDTFPSVHVAGSKGKGSTSVMIASILEAAGYKSGLYTSPHILDFSERIGTASGVLPEQVYEAATRELMQGVDSIIPQDLPGQRPITWFELVTTFAFLCFREAQVDWAVFETGLGGRLDATNVVNPKISVITPIELEHTEFLGATIRKIAGEKAGIIKKNRPVVLGIQKRAALEVLEARAKELHAPVISVADLVKASGKMNGNHMDIKLESKQFSRPITTKLSLLGDYQIWNAATAALTVKSLRPSIKEETIEEGLQRARLGGRFEVLQWEDVEIVLEGAHTPNSIELSLKTFDDYKKNTQSTGKKSHLLFACAADKDVNTIANLFTGFNHVILTRPGGDKQSNTVLLQQAFKAAGHNFTYYQDFNEAIEKSLLESQKDGAILLVTGSFYLVAEVKKWIKSH